MMNIVEVNDDVIWILVSSFNCNDLSQGRLRENIQLYIDKGIVTPKMLANQTVVFNTLVEGHGNEEYEAAVVSIQSEPWFNRQNIIWLNNVIGDSQYQHISLPWRMTNHCGFLKFVKSLDRNWKQSRTKDFVCLMRRPSESRAWISNKIKTKYNNDTYVMTFACMPIDSNVGTYWSDNNSDIKHTRYFLDKPATHEDQHLLNCSAVFDCLINVIVETSNQLDAITSSCWKSIFITEKTFKCFAWRQMPLWFAVPGTVKAVRLAGFDLFDDWIDHSYDSIQDQNLRFNLVFEQLDQLLIKISQQGGIGAVSQMLNERLHANWQRLQQLNHDSMRDFETAIQQIKRFSLTKILSV
jgi:hypothetical protein